VLPDLSGYLTQFEPADCAGELVDANSWLGDPAMCAAVASLAAMWTGRYRATGAVAEALGTLMDPDSWPVFSVRLPSGSSLHVVWRNLEGEAGNDLLLRSGDRSVHTIASLEGHFTWPGISWAELETAADVAVDLSPHQALHVLIPFVGDSAPSGAHARILRAMEATGAGDFDLSPDTLLAALSVPPDRGSWRSNDRGWLWTGMNSLRGGAADPSFRELVTSALRR
jgi:hypothetical protein